MNLLLLTLWMCFICVCKAEQHQFEVVTERLSLGYVDNKLLDFTTSTFKIGQKNAINVTFTYKCDIFENMRYFIKALGWLGNDYRIPYLQIKKSLKDALEMELFDLQSFWVHNAKPPVIWPIKKEVTYRLEGWIPDSTKFPPNLPGGKWKVMITEEFANKTKVLSGDWFFEIRYFK